MSAVGNFTTVMLRLPGAEYAGRCRYGFAGASAREGVRTGLPPKANGCRRHTFLQMPHSRNGVSWRPFGSQNRIARAGCRKAPAQMPRGQSAFPWSLGAPVSLGTGEHSEDAKRIFWPVP